MHGGSVEAHSEGPGKGSEFVVRLPALAEDRNGELRRRRPTRSRPWLPRPRRRILVVDDNVDAAESLAVLLRLEGHEVRTAHDGPAALAAAQADPPDVVFSGHRDAGDGRLRGGPAAAGAAAGRTTSLLVALTGWGQEEDRRRCRRRASTATWPSRWSWTPCASSSPTPSCSGSRTAEG